LLLEAEATAAEGLTIARVTIVADNGWVLKSLVGDTASWEIPVEDREQTWELTGFNWNTKQTGIIDAETLEVGPVIPDGLRTIKLRSRTPVVILGAFVRTAGGQQPAIRPKDLQQALIASGPIAEWTTPLDGTTAPASCTVGLNRQVGTLWTRTETRGHDRSDRSCAVLPVRRGRDGGGRCSAGWRIPGADFGHDHDGCVGDHPTQRIRQIHRVGEWQQ